MALNFRSGRALSAGLIVCNLTAAPQSREPSTTAKPEFEVVSIKPNRSGNKGAIYGAPKGDRFTFTNVSLQMLINVAYRVQDFQIAGGPTWLTSERYDIVAKFEDPAASPAQLQQMIQSMLEKRFQLAVHRETKEMPIFALVKARADGRRGPELQEASDAPCPATTSPPAPGQLPNGPCGGTIFGRGQLRGQKAPLSALAESLSRIIGRTVVDRTGLAGRFDIKLEWTPDESLTNGEPNPAAPSDAAGPSLYTALQEQLGLKPESQRGPVEVLVIDRAEKASDNDN